jgi:alpha-beta hydrolase superfamily lysophospholipase
MNRTTFLGVAGGALAVATTGRRAAAAETDIVLATPTGKIYGTLALPASTPAPLVLIIAGSGPTDRNGNAPQLNDDAYKLLAAALVRHGFASVRYDKRGIAASALAATAEHDLRFDTYIDDTVAWLQMLSTDRRFSKVLVAGHSEGSLLGMLAVQRAPAAAYISLEGAGRPAAVVLREQLKPKLTPALYAQADAIITQLQRGQLVTDTPPELTALFRQSVQPYLISWFAYDPAVEIAKVKLPVTIVQGTADIQVTMADATALHAALPSSKLVVVEGMNHVLKYAPDTSTQAAILKGYQDPTLPIDSHVVVALTTALA